MNVLKIIFLVIAIISVPLLTLFLIRLVLKLSRGVERREDKRPLLSDLAESGAIEAEADLVCFLYRPKYYERRKQQEQEPQQTPGSAVTPPPAPEDQGPEEAEIIIQKHRTGPVGTVNVMFHPRYRRFFDLDRTRVAPPDS